MANLAMTGALGRPVLCIVDADSRRGMLHAFLHAVGFDVHAFDDGAALLLSGLGRQCDVLLVSVALRDMNGQELQSAFTAAGVHVPVIFLFDTPDAPLEARLRARGAAGVLHKPVSGQDVLGAVRVALAGAW